MTEADEPAPAPDEPQFPFWVRWFAEGEEEPYTCRDDLLCNLEEFDSERDGTEAGVWDALGRPLHLTVNLGESRCEYELAPAGRPSWRT